jgi:hypothetical protein
VITEQQGTVLEVNKTFGNQAMFSSLSSPKVFNVPPDRSYFSSPWMPKRFSSLIGQLEKLSQNTITLLTQEQEPKIYLNRNKNGTIDWFIYDPASSQNLSEIEVRSWLKQRNCQ